MHRIMAIGKKIARSTIFNLYFWLFVVIIAVPVGFYLLVNKTFPVEAKIIRNEFLFKTSPYFCEHIDKEQDAAKIWKEIRRGMDSDGLQLKCKPKRLLFNVTDTMSIGFDSFDYRTQHECVLNIVNRYKRSATDVPNVVHNIWMDTRRVEYRFHHFMCTLSMLQRLKPDLLIIWYDSDSALPQGIYWSQLLSEAFAHGHVNATRGRRSRSKTLPKEVSKLLNRNKQSLEDAYRNRQGEQSSTRVIFVKRRIVETVFSRAVVMNEHRTDVVRLEALLVFGGIYLDNDVLVLRDFGPLRTHQKAVLGYEAEKALCNSIIVAPRAASFLLLWYAEYEAFDSREWSYHSVHLPGLLALRCPQYVHTEEDTLNRPSWKELDILYGIGKYANLSRNYAIHLWFRFHDVDYSPESILVVQTTIGRLFRQVYYGVS